VLEVITGAVPRTKHSGPRTGHSGPRTGHSSPMPTWFSLATFFGIDSSDAKHFTRIRCIDKHCVLARDTGLSSPEHVSRACRTQGGAERSVEQA